MTKKSWFKTYLFLKHSFSWSWKINSLRWFRHVPKSHSSVMVLIKQMLLLFWKHHKVVLGAFVFPQHIFAFSPNHYLLSLALRYGNTSLAEIILQKNQNTHHIIYPGWHPVLCYIQNKFRKCLHYKESWMFFKIKSDYWLERFLLLLLCREIL